MLKDCGSKKGETCVKWRGRCNARAVMTSTAHNNIAGALIMSHPYLVIHFRNCRVVLLSKLLSIINPHQYITITVTTTLMIVKVITFPYIDKYLPYLLLVVSLCICPYLTSRLQYFRHFLCLVSLPCSKKSLFKFLS